MSIVDLAIFLDGETELWSVNADRLCSDTGTVFPQIKDCSDGDKASDLSELHMNETFSREAERKIAGIYKNAVRPYIVEEKKAEIDAWRIYAKSRPNPNI